MLKLIIYQFQYSKRQWLGTIPLLFVSSLIVGTSLFGIASAIKTANINASQLFKIRIAEAIIHSVLILLVSVIFNLIILLLVSFIGQLLDRSLVDISGFWQPSLIVISLLVIFYSITKGFYLFQDR